MITFQNWFKEAKKSFDQNSAENRIHYVRKVDNFMAFSNIFGDKSS